MKPPIELAEAQARLLAMARPLAAEEIGAEKALGRCLAAPLTARRTQPSADLSAMDGYAVTAGEPGPWRLVGESAAGHPFAGTLGAGEAVRISTGAPMPDGAGAILLQENAAREREQVALNGEGDPTARHIRRKGFDFSQGDTVLDAGTRIGPAQLALAIAAGNATLPIRRRARLAILDSGDELASDPAECAPHQIPASNGAMIAAMAGGLARDIHRLGPVPDRLDAVTAALEAAAEADIIVTSGGASVGDHDLIRPALEEWGAEIDFWRVAMKPGKPLLVARKGEQIILGLPGNPVSSYVTAFLFLLPLLRALAGDAHPLPDVMQLTLGDDLPPTGARLEFIRAVRAGGMVSPVNEQDSSALRALAASNALIRRDIHSPAAMRGEMVNAYLLANGGIA